MTSGNGASYYYDADGNRVRKVVSGTGTLYWYGAGNVLAESADSGTISHEYVFAGGKRLARIDGCAVHYYLADHLGTTSVVVSQTGTVEERCWYYPFGGQANCAASLTDQHYRFTSKERDSETGLDYFGARYYGGSSGRFLSPDPEGAGAKTSQPLTWNGYTYVLNNPLRLVDPDGKKDKPFNAANGDQPITPIPGTETPLFVLPGVYNPLAYNCHSYAWHGGAGVLLDRSQHNPTPLWENDPKKDASEATQLSPETPNQPGDIVVYYTDSNGNGDYDSEDQSPLGNPASIHSAVVTAVDSDGNTTQVEGKMGSGPLAKNHPNAPGYYNQAEGQETKRAYFRREKKGEDHTDPVAPAN